MKPYVVASGALRSGELMCVATQRTHNAVHLFDGTSWRQLVRWAGHEVTAACACGETIVCAALDGIAYLVNGTAVSSVALPEKTAWVYGAAALSDDVALLGGSGELGLVLLSVQDQSVTRRKLSEFNISRPGRDILNIVRIGPRMLLLGKKNLLVEYRGDSAVELVDRKAVGGARPMEEKVELFFQDAAELGQDLFVAGTKNLDPFLARVQTPTVQFEDIPPIDTKASPSLVRLGDELLMGAGSRLFAGKPGQWRDLLPVPGSILGFVPATGPYPVCAVTSEGHSYFTDGRAHRHVPIL